MGYNHITIGVTLNGISASLTLDFTHFLQKPKVLKLADIARVKEYSFFDPSNFSFEIYLKGKYTPLEFTAKSKVLRYSV